MSGKNNTGVQEVAILNRGKWANADVCRVLRGGEELVYKGFDERSFVVRWTIGFFLTRREIKFLRQLDGVSGIPGNVQRCSPCAFYCQYLDGETLGTTKKRGERLPRDYFIRAEKLLEEIHKRKIVHLDLRRGNNWMVCSDGMPAVIDFQSALNVAFLPEIIRSKLSEIDLSGLYKCWTATCEEPLDSARQALLKRVNRTRKLWIFRGYAWQRNRKRKQ